MPDNAPAERATLIESLGARVERVPVTELKQHVERQVKAGMHFAHPFDDMKLIAGHASLGLEVVPQLLSSAIHSVNQCPLVTHPSAQNSFAPGMTTHHPHARPDGPPVPPAPRRLWRTCPKSLMLWWCAAAEEV